MLKLKSKRMDPPSGWVFQVEDGFHIRAGHFDKLVRSVRRHLEANGDEIPENLEDLVEHYICLQNPQSICVGDGPKRFFPNRRQVEAGTKAIIEAWKAKKEDALVPQDVAEARAQQCVGCKHNINIWACFVCTGLMKLVTRNYGRTTKQDSVLKACAVCGCINAAQVHLSEEVLTSIYSLASAEDYPNASQCWKRAILEKKKNQEVSNGHEISQKSS